jgi:hypothetical protein
MKEIKITAQAVWGSALAVMGIAVFFRIPHIIAKLSTIEYYSSSTIFIRICLYLIAILLFGGGIRKLNTFFKDQRQPKDT